MSPHLQAPPLLLVTMSLGYGRKKSIHWMCQADTHSCRKWITQTAVAFPQLLQGHFPYLFYDIKVWLKAISYHFVLFQLNMNRNKVGWCGVPKRLCQACLAQLHPPKAPPTCSTLSLCHGKADLSTDQIFPFLASCQVRYFSYNSWDGGVGGGRRENRLEPFS